MSGFRSGVDFVIPFAVENVRYEVLSQLLVAVFAAIRMGLQVELDVDFQAGGGVVAPMD